MYAKNILVATAATVLVAACGDTQTEPLPSFAGTYEVTQWLANSEGCNLDGRSVRDARPEMLKLEARGRTLDAHLCVGEECSRVWTLTDRYSDGWRGREVSTTPLDEEMCCGAVEEIVMNRIDGTLTIEVRYLAEAHFPKADCRDDTNEAEPRVNCVPNTCSASDAHLACAGQPCIASESIVAELVPEPNDGSALEVPSPGHHIK